MARSILSGLLLLVACAPAAPPVPAADPVGDETAVRSTYERFTAAWNVGDAAAIVAFYTPAAVRIPPDSAMVSGADALMSGLTTFFGANQYTLDEAPIDDIQMSGDLAVVRGSWRDTAVPRAGGEASQSQGRWLTVWRRQADGSWQITLEMWSMPAMG